MGGFTQASWFLSGATLSVLLYGVTFRKQVLVKPSFLVASALHVTIQWSSTWNAGLIERSIHSTGDYFLLVQVLPFLIALGSLLTFDSTARSVQQRLCAAALFAPSGFFLVLGLFCSGLVLTWYVSEVGWEQMGLYALLKGEGSVALAREYSYKLVSHAGLKYAYTLFSTVFAPLLSVAIALGMIGAFQKQQYRYLVLGVLTLGVLLLGVSLYGARAPSAMIVLAILYAFVLRKGSIPRLQWIPLLLLVLFIAPALISLKSSGLGLTWENLHSHFLNVLDRAFGRTIVDGIWHFQYVEKHGYFGWAGIGNIIRAFGIEPVNSFNQVGQLFAKNQITSVSANTPFSIAYYSCLGVGVFFPCLFLVLAMDSVILVYEKLENAFVLPCVAACGIAATNLNATFFTTVLFTFGFAVIPALCLLLQEIEPPPIEPQSLPL